MKPHLRPFRLLFPLVAVLSQAPAAAGSTYDLLVLGGRPTLYLPLSAPTGRATEQDLGSGRHNGTYKPASAPVTKARMQNGDTATVFDGQSQYLEIPSAPSFSVPADGALTVEAWIRPDVLEFPRQEGDGYVHWAGKGETGEQEYALRMYSATNTADRPSRISGYAFNLQGGLGSGSYFQDAVTARRWIHVAMVIDQVNVSIFKNGVLRKTTPLSQFGVVPMPGNAPVRVATRDLHSFFKGAIGKFAIYDRAVPAAELLSHYREMMRWR